MKRCRALRWWVPCVVLIAAVGWTAAAGLSITGRGSCSAAQKAQNALAVAAYARQMPAKRAAYFASHRRPAARAAFVRRQEATLAGLRRAAACAVPAASTVPPTTTTPPDATDEVFSFGPEMTGAAEGEIRDDVDYGARDEARLLGARIASVSAFASSSPDWLAAQECSFLAQPSSCAGFLAGWQSGGTASGGDKAGIFLNWSSSGWSYGAGENQTIVAHELFHVLQYQLDKSVDDRIPRSDDVVRASGPVWLEEGSAQFVGHRVAVDRGMVSAADVVERETLGAQQLSTPLSRLQTYDDPDALGAYELYALAVDHLVAIAPGGPASLAAYYTALGNGLAWPDAFAAAFGITIDEYYPNFAGYRAAL